MWSTVLRAAMHDVSTLATNVICCLLIDKLFLLEYSSGRHLDYLFYSHCLHSFSEINILQLEKALRQAAIFTFNHVSMIRFFIGVCHFLLVVHWNPSFISSRFRDIFWPNMLMNEHTTSTANKHDVLKYRLQLEEVIM